jgi:hypothetical protein
MWWSTNVDHSVVFNGSMRRLEFFTRTCDRKVLMKTDVRILELGAPGDVVPGYLSWYVG